MTQYVASVPSSCFASINSTSSISQCGSPKSFPHRTVSRRRKSIDHRLGASSRNGDDRIQYHSTQTTSSSSPPREPRSRQPPPRLSTRAPGRRPLRALPPPPVIGAPTSTYPCHHSTYRHRRRSQRVNISPSRFLVPLFVPLNSEPYIFIYQLPKIVAARTFQRQRD